jgi:hypothetical protein
MRASLTVIRAKGVARVSVLAWMFALCIAVVAVPAYVLLAPPSPRLPEPPTPGGPSGPPGVVSAPLDSARRHEAAIDSGVAESPGPAPSDSAVIEVAGTVIDLRGHGVPDVPIVGAGDGEPFGTSGDDGRFRLAVPVAVRTLVAGSEQYVTVAAGVCYLTSEGMHARIDPRIVVARKVSVAGLVLGERGAPVASAHLAVTLRPDHVARDSIASTTHVALPTAVSDASGEFAIAAAAGGARLYVEARGHQRRAVDIPDLGGSGLLVRLEPLQRSPRTVVGRVVQSATGEPVEGAFVTAGGDCDRTDHDGAFVLDLAEPSVLPMPGGRSVSLQAAKKGYLPATLTFDAGTPPANPTLQLAASELRIRGVAVDAEGQPIAGALVFVADGTPFGCVGCGPGVTRFVEVESVLGEPKAVTAADGRFELSGLVERDYEIVALDRRTMAEAVSPSVTAGTNDVRLVFTASRNRVLRGFVVDGLGNAVGGATVQAGYRAGWSGPEDKVSEFVFGPTVRANASGGFELPGVSRRNAVIRVSAPEMLPLIQDVADADGNAVTVTVKRRARLEIHAPRPASLGSCRALDAAGRPVSMFVLDGRSYSIHDAITLRAATVVSVPDTVVALRVTRQDGTVTLVPVQLRADSPNRVVVE